MPISYDDMQTDDGRRPIQVWYDLTSRRLKASDDIIEVSYPIGEKISLEEIYQAVKHTRMRADHQK